MSQYKTAIFDLDGTLLNTLQDLCISTNAALNRFGWMNRTLTEVRRFVGNGTRVLMANAVPGGEQNPLFEQSIEAFKEAYAEHQFDHTKPYDGIPEALAELQKRGVQMAIVSNKVDFAVKDLNKRFFGLAIACGDKKGQRRKPAPDVVQEAMRQLGADPASTVYIGDSEVDIATARNAGLPCITVLWGFRDKAELIEAGAQTFAETPADLLRLILK